MTLSEKDFRFVLETDKNMKLEQLQQVVDSCIYQKCSTKIPYTKGNEVSAEEAYKLLGNEKFISGIYECLIYKTAVRNYNSKNGIFFNYLK